MRLIERLLTGGALLKRSGSVSRSSGSLLFETESEKLFGKDFSSLEGEVFKLGHGSAPFRALGSEEIESEFFSDAFEVGSQGFDFGVVRSIESGGLSHPSLQG